jgi:Zn-dependent oligopeptidase
MLIHKKENYSLKEIHNIWFDITKNILPFMYNNINNKLFIKNIHPMCSFGHLVGYDVGYYSYLWSIIYSYDIYSIFKKNGIFNKKIGMNLRTKILEKGATKSGVELLIDFIGRKHQ